MERSLLSSNHPEKQFDVKLPMAGKVFALVCLLALSTQFAVAQNKIAVNALPTGGKVVAGAATISSTSTATSATMNINQTSQRAVINWQTFNVGKNATVNFNQPNSSAVTLNRVVSATPSMIQGAINANGQVILVNPNGVTFGKGAEVNAAGVVASTLNISNQDFMNGKNIYSGNGEGKIVNKGTITATDPNGYIALLAPEIRNQGYLIARMGPSSTVALASGEKISLDFRGTQLIGVSIDKAAYKALIENKRIIETNGGLIIVAAGTARELMSSVIQNTGRISANSIVDNGGVIELVADNVTNSGSISANGGTNGVGGQVNIVGNNITLAANSKTTATGNLGGGSIQVGVGKTVATNTTPASAVNGNANTAAAPQTAAQILASNTQGVGTQAQTVSVEQGAVIDASAINSGNGGAIVIWSQVKTTVNGILKAVGGYLNGNGGLIETSSAGLVSLGKSLSIDTSSSKGSAGLWYVDPIDLTIDGASSAVISAALVNNNVSITVAGNTCPSLGSCTQNGSGNLTIASGADIIKQSGSLTTLTLTASGVFNLNANISGQNLDVIINSSIAYLNAGSTITANQVTVQAQTIYSYGNINSGSLSNLGSAIQLLGSALYISGNLTVGANLANSSNSTNSNSNTVSYNGTLIRQEDLPTYLAAANQTTLNLDQVYATMAANQASFTTAVNNQITLNGTESISIAATAQLLANGTTGGVIMATAPQINLVTSSNSSPSSGSQSIQGNGSLIQANGNNGPGGTISFTAANDFNINFATISASGSTDGGSIRLISSGGNLLMANSLIQTNGGTGRGGSLGVSGANSTTINSSTLEATGYSKGGSIMVGYDSAGKTLPYSESTTIDAASILSANQTDSTNTTGGGLIETSGGTLTQLASINAGRGGMWLLDPYDYIINSSEASNISTLLNNGTNVSISTSNASVNLNGQVVNGLTGGGTIYIFSTIDVGTTSRTASLTFSATSISISSPITTNGNQTYNGDVVVNGDVQMTSNGGNVTITGTLSGGYKSSEILSLLGNGAWTLLNNGQVINSGTLVVNAPTVIPGTGILTYTGTGQSANYDGSVTSGYTWIPTYTSLGQVLVVGAGGGGAGPYGGGGGGGGGVSSTNLLPSLIGGTTYTISVGIGGTAGDYVVLNGSRGGGSLISGNGLSTIYSVGGAGGAGFGVGGSALGGVVSSSSQQCTACGANGVLSNITGSYFYYGGGGGAGFYTVTGSTLGPGSTLNSASFYNNNTNTTAGWGSTLGRAAGAGEANTGMGGGGGMNSGPYLSVGANGANGLVALSAVLYNTSSLSINNASTVSLNSINGSGVSGSLLQWVAIAGNSLTSAITGNIQGNLSLSLSGTTSIGGNGKIILSGQNSFTGTVTIYEGTVLAGSSTAFGGSVNTIEVAHGITAATLDFNGQTLGAYTIDVKGAGVGNLGAIINSSATTANFAGSVNLTNVSFIGGAGTGNGAGTIYFNGSVNTNGYGLGFVNYSNDYMTGNNNQISTIAGSNMAILQLASTTNVTIGSVNGSSIFSGPIASGLSFASNSGSYLLINLPNNALTINNSITAAAISITASNASGGLDAISMSGSYSITSPGGLGINITSTSGNINLASATITNIYSSCCSVPTSAINITSAGDVSLGNLVNQGQGGIRIAAGNQISAGITSGGTITQLGTVNNSGGVVGLSMAAPETSNCASSAACPIESRLGITASNADVSKNISYGVAGGSFTTPGAYTTGNYIDYRQSPSVTYNVSLGSNYTAIYGTSYISSSANTWLATNATVSIAGTAFGYSVSGALANLRFKNSIDGVTSANNVQSTSITSNSLMSSDLTPINVTGTTQTYTITPAPLGISVNGVYSGTNVITPTSFTTYGLVNGDTIGGLSTATLAFKDVNSVNNYVTAISIGTGSAILSNYQLNPLGRNIATNSALMNTVTLTPIALTVSGAVAANKTYDGTTVATLSASGLNGVLAQDTANVALTLSSGSFANKNVGTNITVTAAGSISGSAVAAGDYTLIQPTVTANISPAPLGVSISGTYTGSTLINNPNIGIAGLVNNETLTSISQAVMSSPNVSANGSNYVVSFTIGAGTASLSNYVINSGYYATPGYTNNMVTLTPKTLTISGSSTYSKTYDGTNVASINPGTLVGVINSDDVSILSNAGTFSSAGVGNNISVTSNMTLGGAAATNYSLTQPTGLTANISKAPLGISIAATYNGSTTVTPTILNVNGLVNGETLSSITSAVISNANVANTLTTYATSITIGSGTASMSNYMLGSTRNNSTSSNSENMVTITPKALSLSAVKVYDGTTTLSGSQITMTGLIGTQTLNYTGANINDANVATPNKYISSITLTDGANGGLASNYLAPTLTSAYTYNNATVNQKAVALSATKVYDANNTLTGGQVTINTGVSGETLTYSGATVNDINVATAGKYINAITLGNAVSGNGVASNYLLPTLNSTNAPVTITKASLTVTANAAAMTYGASVLPSFSATITGFVGSDTSSAVTGTASFSTNATPYNGQAGSGSSVGTYSITPALGSLASGNYSFGVFSQGSLVVNKGNLTITASNDSKVYGASSTTAGVNYTAGGTAINSTAGYTTSGLVNGDTITAVTLTSTGGAVPTNVGTYTITPSALVGGTNVTNSNYTISYINASTGLAVNPKVVTLAATKTYDATNALNTVVISGLIGSQTLTYSGATTNDVNVATTGKYLNAITLGNATDGSGGLAANYTLPSLTVASANNAVTITPKVVGLSASKTYDATTTLTGTQVVITTGVGSQTLNYTGATANDANVATANKYISAITLANATDSSGGLASNYALPTLNNANAALTITPKALSLSAVKVYDGTTTLSGSQITMTGLIGTQTLNYTGANINDANVATPNKYISSITLTDGANGGLASNYLAPTLTSAYTYNNATVNQKAVALSATKVYDANNTLTGGQVTINTGVSGETLTYSGATVNDINVATAGKYINAITLGNAVSGNGVASNYLLPTLNSTNAPVTVNPAPLTVTGSISPGKTYDGTTITTVSNGQLQGLLNNQTLTLSQAGAFGSANAGTAVNVVVNDSITNGTGTNAGIASNYSLTQPTDVVANITPKNLTVTGSATSNKIYDGTFTATITGGQLVGVVAADIANVVLTQAGTFTTANVGNAIAITANDSITGSQAGNYSLTQPTVAAANITPKTVSLSATKTYDSTTSLLGAVTILTGVGTETLGYTVATASDANVVTTGKYITAITLVNGSGLASNYVLPVLNVANAPVTINPVTALVVVGATAQGKAYDGTTSVTLSNTGTLQGLIGNQTLTLTEAGAFTSANAGSGVFVVMNDRIADGTNGGLASNYSLTQPTYVMAPIAKAPLGVTVTGTYTASTTIAPSTFTTNGLVNNEMITTLSSATVNDANAMTANNYVKSIVIGAGTANMNNYVIGPNYNNLAGNTQNIATITPKVITVSGTQVANKEYNATTTANLTGGTLVGVINSDSANVNLVQAGNFASANIGNPVAVTASDTITGSAASNYSLTQPTGLSAIITSKALTITIAAETKIYGDGIAKTSNSVDGTNTSSQSVNYTNGVATNSFQGFSVSGLVTGSNDAVNTVTLTSAGGALTAGVASGAAAYAITGSGAVGVNLGNYAINYVSNNYSVMTVTPRPLNVTVANASMAYGATALPNFTSTITGLVNGDQASAVLSTTATPYNGQAGSASNVGSYAITAAAVSNANYSVISTNGTLTVNPVTLVLQANTQGGTGSPIVYGTPTVLNQNASVALTPASLVGLTNGDYINTVSVTFNGSQTISGATAAGTYTGALVASGASGTGLSNYTISYQPGNLIISKAVLTVTAANDARFTSQTEATPYNGVIFSGFKNGETSSVLDMTQLVINRTNSTVNAIGSYTGVLIPQGVSSQNYTIQYQPGNYSILGSGQVLVKYAPITMNYGSVTNANINYGTPVVSYMAAGSNLVSSSDSLGTVTVNPTIANLQNSTAGYLNTGSYSLNPTATITSSTTNLSNLAVTVVGGITVMPKVLSFANLGISGVSKVYDGLTTMTGLSLNVATGIFLAQGPAADNVTVVANGAFTDKNVGTAKSYTVGVSFGGADANNYVISGGGVYIADGITNPANGAITQLSSVTYIGAATGGAWSDPNSWQVTNGTTKGAIPDASMVNGVATNNVANIIVPVGNTVVYDAGVSNAAPITSNLANAGNVSFGSALASNATFNVAMTISGAGSVTIAGPGTITLSGANTYTGNTIISNGSTLSVTVANSIGAGNIQGSGGSLRVANGISLAQINATGTLRLLSDVVTSGNQAWGNLTVTQSPLTTLTSTNGNITFNGLLDGASSKANSLLVLAPNGNVTFNNSVGSVMPLNVLEADASRININADVLTSDQQNYCGIAGCYSQLSSAQVSANYCATTGNNCYSKNTSTLAYNLLASGTGTTGDYVLNTDIQGSLAPTAQVYIGDNGAVGFLYNTYGTYATKAFGSTPPLFQNNAVFARTLISKDPMVNFGGAINDASAASTHTLQAAAIKVSNASSPNIQFGGSVGSANPLYSINALTQFIDAANSMNGSIKFAANTTITSISNMSYGSNSFTPTGVTFQTVSPSASINFVVPAGSPFSLAGGQIKSNYVNYNGAATRTLGGITAQVSLSGGIVTPRAAAPVSAPSTRNSFILAAVAEQTKIERKYDVDASVDVGEIETDDGPSAKDEEDQKKKKAGNQKAAQ
ncbi:filamentous hemagglutinin N-terminal domain-containing protein [Polynucleobacter paneuropaeus]|nr:filamentous hemagglutinin N-terminal domain-containing protein [Polynucleobacter paneuropaeus]